MKNNTNINLLCLDHHIPASGDNWCESQDFKLYSYSSLQDIFRKNYPHNTYNRNYIYNSLHFVKFDKYWLVIRGNSVYAVWEMINSWQIKFIKDSFQERLITNQYYKHYVNI